jgi:hypothetical protein
MSIYVFTGPTLSAEEAADALDASYLPPVAQGDLYRVALARPRAIGIIDGYFERVPAVWHKEILWALAQRIPVFGSASMGALRAAELAPYGMIGVGEIFEAYREGRLEDDDEVAVAHASAADGYRPLSEPMVNIRQTLRCAQAACVIGPSTRSTLERIAKALFYPERLYPVVIQRGLEQGLPAPELAALERWLPSGRVDQKRADAIAMLQAMQAHLSAGVATPAPAYTLEYTMFLDRLLSSASDFAASTDSSAEPISGEALLDELFLDGDLYARAYQGALARHLALLEAQRQDFVIDDEALDDAIAEFCQLRGLSQDRLEPWLEANQLSYEQFRDLVRENALVNRLVVYRIGWAVRKRMADQLRLAGEYDLLAQRARHKRSLLAAFGLDNPTLEDVGLTRKALLAWHSERSQQLACQSAQGRMAITTYARDNPAAFTRALLREFCYLTILDESAQEPASASCE